MWMHVCANIYHICAIGQRRESDIWELQLQGAVSGPLWILEAQVLWKREQKVRWNHWAVSLVCIYYYYFNLWICVCADAMYVGAHCSYPYAQIWCSEYEKKNSYSEEITPLLLSLSSLNWCTRFAGYTSSLHSFTLVNKAKWQDALLSPYSDSTKSICNHNKHFNKRTQKWKSYPFIPPQPILNMEVFCKSL